MGSYDDLVLLILEDGFGFGSVAVVNFGNGEGTFYGVAKIYGLLEAKIHSGGQPADLPANFGGQTGDCKAMANSATKIFCVCEAIIEMHGIVVAAEVGEGQGVLFGEGAGNGERVARL